MWRKTNYSDNSFVFLWIARCKLVRVSIALYIVLFELYFLWVCQIYLSDDILIDFFFTKMQITLFKFGLNSFWSTNFTFVQLSSLSFKFIQFRHFIKFWLKKNSLKNILFSHEKIYKINKKIYIFYVRNFSEKNIFFH